MMMHGLANVKSVVLLTLYTFDTGHAEARHRTPRQFSFYHHSFFTEN